VMFLLLKLVGLVVWTHATYSISLLRRLVRQIRGRPNSSLALEDAVLRLILNHASGPDAHAALWSAASDSSSRFCDRLHAQS
jgi:hypothetical protein